MSKKMKIKPGQRVDKLTVIEDTGTRKYGRIIWCCRCDCGNEVLRTATQLRNNRHCDCGCGARKHAMPGQRFGKLTVIEDTGMRNKGSIIWRCRCDCGNEVQRTVTQLWKSKHRDCGYCKDSDHSIKPGMRLGKLTVFEEIRKPHRWKCLCDCGNEILLTPSKIRSGKTTHCGCSEYTRLGLIGPGYRFGHLKIIEKTDQRSEGGLRIIWRCRCDCGNEILLDTARIVRHSPLDCGCSRVVNPGANDLTGMRFGRLICLYPEPVREGESVVWRCRCDCGNECSASNHSLQNGYKTSCGCLLADMHESGTNLKYIESIMRGKLRSNNTTGTSGLYYNKKKNRWQAYLRLNGKRHYLGSYENKEDAIKARKDAEEKFFRPVLQKYKLDN